MRGHGRGQEPRENRDRGKDRIRARTGAEGWDLEGHDRRGDGDGV